MALATPFYRRRSFISERNVILEIALLEAKVICFNDSFSFSIRRAINRAGVVNYDSSKCNFLNRCVFQQKGRGNKNLDGSGLTLSRAVYISLVPREIYNRVSIQDSVARI